MIRNSVTRPRRLRLPTRLCAVVALAALQVAGAQETSPSSDASADQHGGPPNVAGPTLGGKQFWSDELVFHDWRIQRNVWTSHYRLLDDKNVRRAWGSFPQCRGQFETLRRRHQLPPLQPRVVLVLHGLGRSRQSMEEMCRHLRAHSGCTVLNVSYASTREQLQGHARSLARIIDHLEGVREVGFVAHSMGNLVIRRYLADRTAADTGPQARPQIGRVVMIAPPNNGAQLAERFRRNQLFRTIMGASGTALADDWDSLEEQLATPTCQFGIIAGGSGGDLGRNPLLRGDDDLVVSVAETRLSGARDFVVVPAFHTVIMNHPTVQEYTLRFLRNGHFIAENKRCPIPPDDGNPDVP